MKLHSSNSSHSHTAIGQNISPYLVAMQRCPAPCPNPKYLASWLWPQACPRGVRSRGVKYAGTNYIITLCLCTPSDLCRQRWSRSGYVRCMWMWMCAVSVEWDCMGRVLTITYYSRAGWISHRHHTLQRVIQSNALYNTPLHPYYSGGIIKLPNCRHT